MPFDAVESTAHSGAMRQRIAFEQRTTVLDEYGNSEGDWATVFTVAAQLVPRKGGEIVLASRLTGVNTFVIYVRYSAQMATVDTTWRARNTRTGDIYNIRNLDNPDQKQKFIELLVTSGDAV